MKNNEILERLRNYNFFQRLDLKNEYEDRLERFLIMVGRSQKFQLENGNKINYSIIKKLLKKKNIDMKRDEHEYNKHKIQLFVEKNIDSLKWRILDDLNVIFKTEKIKFCFIKEKNDTTTKKTETKIPKITISKRLEKYNFPIKSIGIFENYKELLENFLIVTAKSNLFKLQRTNEDLTYSVIKFLLSKKCIPIKINPFEYNFKGIPKNIYDNLESLKYNMLSDLNEIFDKEDIEFSFKNNRIDNINNKKVDIEEIKRIVNILRKYNFKNISNDLIKEFQERLEKFLILVRKTKLFQIKETKEPITFEIANMLMKKKNLTLMKNKKEFQNGGLQEKFLNELDVKKHQILNDLNFIFKKDNIEFELVTERIINNTNTNNEELKDIISILDEFDFCHKKNKGNNLIEICQEMLVEYMVRVVKMNCFKIEKNTTINYETILELLKKKEINISITKDDFLEKVKNILYIKISLLKDKMLNSLNRIFEKDKILFSFNEEDITKLDEKMWLEMNETMENDSLEFCFEQINKGYKTLFLDLDEISENKYQKVINYANNNSYKLIAFSRVPINQNRIATRVLFEKL